NPATLALGLAASYFFTTSSTIFPMAAPPGTRFQPRRVGRPSRSPGCGAASANGPRFRRSSGLGAGCFGGQDGAGLVVAVAGAGIGREARDEHIGPPLPNHPDHVSEHLLLVPDGEGLGRGLAKAEVVGAGKVLVRPVDAAGRQQLLGTDNAELLAQFGADE
nr:hypothetical protein [Tanacetum cinerariifolium]